LITLALVFVLEELTRSAAFTGGSNGLTGVSPLFIGLGPLTIDMGDPRQAVLVSAALVVVVYLALRALTATRFGAAVVLVREDETLARSMGYRPAALRGSVLVLSSAIAGLGGVLLASSDGGVFADDIGFNLSAQAVVWLLLGGSGSLAGAIVGVCVLEYVRIELGTSLADHWLLAQGALLVAVARFMPRGLVGVIERGVRFLSRSRTATSSAPPEPSPTEREVTGARAHTQP
jgi:ABC-type branched-subunit amino acid transport system permease subunit